VGGKGKKAREGRKRMRKRGGRPGKEVRRGRARKSGKGIEKREYRQDE
jgi:hypothetical protein